VTRALIVGLYSVPSLDLISSLSQLHSSLIPLIHEAKQGETLNYPDLCNAYDLVKDFSFQWMVDKVGRCLVNGF
jgi:hypothetical protein